LFPENLKFACCDIAAAESESSEVLSSEPFDTLICCSVTKWIQLNHGDDGLMNFFNTMFNLLAPGGLAVLEYQPWKSYERNKNTSEKTKMMFKTIQIRPDRFEDILINSVGFSLVSRLGTPLEEAKGFNRPILVLSKPLIPTTTTGGLVVKANAISKTDEFSVTRKRKRGDGFPMNNEGSDDNDRNSSEAEQKELINMKKEKKKKAKKKRSREDST
jgi:hypothetical protein